MSLYPCVRELAEGNGWLVSVPTQQRALSTNRLALKPERSPYFYSNSMVSVTQDPNVLKAEIGAKCRGTPRWLVTDPVKRTAKRTWAPFIRGRGASCLGRVWPHSSVCVGWKSCSQYLQQEENLPLLMM